MSARKGNIAFLVLAFAFLAIGLAGQRMFMILAVPFLALYLASAVRSRR
jgi:hypothetical protein